MYPIAQFNFILKLFFFVHIFQKDQSIVIPRQQANHQQKQYFLIPRPRYPMNKRGREDRLNGTSGLHSYGPIVNPSSYIFSSAIPDAFFRPAMPNRAGCDKCGH